MGVSAYGIHFSLKWIPFDFFVLGVVKELITITFIFLLGLTFTRVRVCVH